jgi:hypothetical protein
MLMVLLAFTKFCWNVPAPHVEQKALPLGESRPCKHCEHFTAAAELYLAVSHNSHILLELAPSAELALPAGHELQVTSDVAPYAVEYFPAAHSTQLLRDDWPRNAPKRPGGHESHDDFCESS